MSNQADNGHEEFTLTPTIEAGVINALQHDCGQSQRDRGFAEDWDAADWLEQLADKCKRSADLGMDEITKLCEIAAILRTNTLGMKLALMHSEISEALETLRRNGGAAGMLAGEGNFGEELADVMIRAMATGALTRDPLGDRLMAKMAVNQERPYHHDNKVV